MRIFYLAPDSERPSWGVGIIYNHVKILADAGWNAMIIKEKKPQPPSWLNIELPIQTEAYLRKEISADDILVVPEVMMGFRELKKLQCKKILLLQAPGFLFESMPRGEDHQSLGFSHVFIIMPHMKSIVEKHVRLPFSIIPPYVADYFFNREETERKRQILIYPKFHQIDFSIVSYILNRYLESKKQSWLKNLTTGANWHLKEIKDLAHNEVAAEMKKSAFFISLNLFEALNTSVTEAMAAGCVVFCYEGFGPRDYLKNNQNALVFGNNEAYALAESVIDWIEHFEETIDSYREIQRNAYITAGAYTRTKTSEALLATFEKMKTQVF